MSAPYSPTFDRPARCPTGVTVIAILLFYIPGVLWLLAGSLLIVLALVGLVDSRQIPSLFGTLLAWSSGAILFLGLVIAGFGWLWVWIGNGLRRLRDGFRVAVIALCWISLVLNALGFIANIFIVNVVGVLFGLIEIGILVIVLVYLSSRNVRAAFDRRLQPASMSTSPPFSEAALDSWAPTLERSPNRAEQQRTVAPPPRVLQPRASLVVQQGGSRGKPFELRPGRNLIGRGEDCHIRLVNENRYVSRCHAEIVFSEGRLYIRHLSESNPTIVNGHRIQDTELRNGDILQICDFVLQVRTAW